MKAIFFDAESIKAILAGKKTQTRRVIASPRHMRHETLHDAMTYAARDGVGDWVFSDFAMSLEFVLKAYPGGNGIRCPYGYPGDRLWVREVWGSSHTRYMPGLHCWYYADGEPPFATGPAWRKRSPIHMPRWASRITLQVGDVRVQRLQQISDADIEAEMAWSALDDNAPANFSDRWDAINAKRGWPWSSNPWVWVIEFKLVQP